MGNLVKYTMTNVPAGLSQMYTRVTDTANNELFSGVQSISGNAVELDIGTAGNVGDGAIIFSDNFEGNISNFKANVGYSTIEKTSHDLVMSVGQSLSIGTLDGNFNPKPDQPELGSNYKVFNGTGSVGLERAVITDELTSSFVQYEEGSTHAPSFYTHGTSFLKSAFNNTNNLLWVNAGIGGEKIEDLDLGGNTEAYNNQIKYLERAKLIDDIDVKAITFFQGSTNTGDRQQDYYDKMVTYEANQQALIKSVIPDHPDVPFVFYQKGGGRRGLTVQQAQLDFMKNRPESKCVGGTYWLNRQHPNTESGVNGAVSSDRVHLSVSGYRYLGDMAAISYKTDNYKPMYVEAVSLDSPKILRLSVHVPFGGNMAFDTTSYNTPQFNGYGVELQNADGTLVVPTDVQIQGNDLLVIFVDDVLYGSRLRIGYTPEDIGEDFDTPVGDYPDTLTGTNIRSDYAHTSSVGLSDFYDWLCCDVIYLYQDTSGMPAYLLGSECWRDNSSTGVIGYGQNFRWDGTNLTQSVDGQDVQSPISTFVLGTSNPEINFGIRQGKTYRVTCDVNITTSDFIRIYVGGFAKVSLTSANNGAFSEDIVADGDYKIEMRVESSSIVATLDNVSIREVLA